MSSYDAKPSFKSLICEEKCLLTLVGEIFIEVIKVRITVVGQFKILLKNIRNLLNISLNSKAKIPRHKSNVKGNNRVKVCAWTQAYTSISLHNSNTSRHSRKCALGLLERRRGSKR